MRSSTLKSARPQRTLSRGGFSILYIPLILLLLVAFVAMAVDTGRIRLAKAQLQGASDAAARAGATGIPTSISVSGARAQSVANLNPVAERSVQFITASDAEWGKWNATTHIFTVINDDSRTTIDERNAANAIHAFARAQSARGTAVPLWITPHVTTFDRNGNGVSLSTVSNLQAEAVAFVGGGPNKFGFVGIDSISSNGTTTINGNVASDGNITLGKNGVVGDARAGIGATLSGTATGWTANLDYKLAPLYQPADASGATVVTAKKNQPLVLNGNNNPNSPTKYVINGNLDKPRPLTVNGYVELYVKGSVDFSGNGSTIGNPLNPGQLTLKVVGSGSVTAGGNAAMYMHLYAPQSSVTITGNGNGGFYGWAIGKSLTTTGNTDLHDDGTRDSGVPYKITLVR